MDSDGMLNGETIKLRRMNTNKASFSRKLPYSRHSDEVFPLAPATAVWVSKLSVLSDVDVTQTRKKMSLVNGLAGLLMRGAAIDQCRVQVTAVTL